MLFVQKRASSIVREITLPDDRELEGSRLETASSAPLVRERLLPLQAGQNFRDLGGYETENGRAIRWGLIYRSGSMHFLTYDDHEYLQKIALRTVCDFRDVTERAVEPVIWSGSSPPVLLVDDYKMVVGGIGMVAPEDAATVDDAHKTMRAIYPELLVRFNNQYRRMFSELLAGRAPLAFNCTAGKDRTGIAAALLLTALHVPRSTIIFDYMLTNKYFDQTLVTHSVSKKPMKWESLAPDIVMAYMSANPLYISAVIDEIDRYPGGSGFYLQDRLGLTPEKRAILSEMYTD